MIHAKMPLQTVGSEDTVISEVVNSSAGYSNVNDWNRIVVEDFLSRSAYEFERVELEFQGTESGRWVFVGESFGGCREATFVTSGDDDLRGSPFGERLCDGIANG